MACSMRSTRTYGIFVCSARILAIVDFPVAGRPPITTSTGRTERCSHFRFSRLALMGGRRASVTVVASHRDLFGKLRNITQFSIYITK